MADTSLVFNVLAKSNLARVLGRDAIAVRALSSSMKSLGRGVQSAAKFAPLAAGIASSAHAAVGLTAALAPAVGIVAAVPGAAALAGGALATLKVAFFGVGDAISSALSDDAEAFNKALEEMTPAVQRVAKEVRTLKPVFDDLKNSVQSAMFAPLRGEIAATANALMGPLKTGMTGVSAEFGKLGKGLLGIARSAQTVGLVEGVFSRLRGIVSQTSGSVLRLVTAIRNFTASTLPAFDNVGGAIGRVIDKFATFLDRAASSGQALGWVNAAVGVLSQLGAILGNIGGILVEIFRPMQETGAGVLSTLTQVTGMVREFLASAQGQEALTGLFQALGSISAAVLPLFKALLTAIAPLTPMVGQLVQQLAGALGPALLQVVQAITPLLPPVGELIVAIVTGLIPIIPSLAELLSTLAGVIVSVLVPALRFITPIVSGIIDIIVGLVGTIMGVLSGAINWLSANVPKAWNFVANGIRAAVNTIKGIINWFGQLPGMIGRWVQGARNAAVSKFQSMVAWVRGLPGRIKSAIGNLGNLLVGAGRSVVTGLWNGIKSMGSWLRSTLIGWARSLIPGPIAKALGIASPSRVMAREVGRWVPPGIVEGAMQAAPAMNRALADLVQPERPAVVQPLGGLAARASGAQAGRGRSEVTVRLVADGADKELTRLLRKIVRVEGRGNVQMAFGR